MATDQRIYGISKSSLRVVSTLLLLTMFAFEAFSADGNGPCESHTAIVQLAKDLDEIQRMIVTRDLKEAENKMVDLETAWIIAEPEFRGANQTNWDVTNKAVSNAVSALQRAKPDADAALKSLKSLQDAFSRYCEI